MRLALLLIVTWGLVPGLRVVAESGMDQLRDGHALAAHTPGTGTDPDDGAPEHFCGAVHLCSCCSSQQVVSGPVTAVAPPAASPGGAAVRVGVLPTYVAIDRPFRPPIA